MSAAGDEELILVVRRVMPVPRERVFAAWLDPERLARFMKPGDVTRSTAVVDPRVGGKFRIDMMHGRGDAAHWGEYLVIDPPSRLSFTWISASTDHKTTVVTIELNPVDGGTELILTHRGVPARTFDAHDKGWDAIVRQLDEELRR